MTPILVFTVLTGLAAIFIGHRSGRMTRGAIRTWRALRRSSGKGFDRHEPGPLAVRGKVSAIDRIRSDHTEREGIFLRCMEEVWDTQPNMMGHSGKWVQSRFIEEATPFELTDGEGALLVDPAGAEVLAPSTRGRDGERRHVESVIEDGEELVVVGEIREEGGFDPSEGYRGTNVRQVLCAGKRGLVIATPALARSRLTFQLAFGVGGLATAAVLLACAATGLSNLFPAVDISLPGKIVQRTAPPPDFTQDRWARWNQDAVEVGPARVEITVLGWQMGSRVRDVADERLVDGLWRRQLNGVVHEDHRRERKYLLFFVETRTLKISRHRAFWESMCTLEDRCPAGVMKDPPGAVRHRKTKLKTLKGWAGEGPGPHHF